MGKGEIKIEFIHTHLLLLYFRAIEYINLHTYVDIDVCVCMWLILCVFVSAPCDRMLLFGIFFQPFKEIKNRGKSTTAAPNRLALTITATNYGCLT